MAENQFTHTENEIFDWRVSPSDYGIDVSTYRIGGFAEKKHTSHLTIGKPRSHQIQRSEKKSEKNEWFIVI